MGVVGCFLMMLGIYAFRHKKWLRHQDAKGKRLSYGSCYAKTVKLVAVVRDVPNVNSRRQVIRGDGPRAATEPTFRTTRFPRPSIAWRSTVAVFKTILHPLPHIAVHVIQTPGVGGIDAYGGGLVMFLASLGR